MEVLEWLPSPDPIDMLIALVGAIMIPFAVSASSTVIPNARASAMVNTCGESMVRWAAYLVLAAMYAIQVLGVYYYYKLFVPVVSSPDTPARAFHVFVSVYGLIKGNYDFLSCVFRSPNQWKWELFTNDRTMPEPVISNARVPKWCSKCCAPKPVSLRGQCFAASASLLPLPVLLCFRGQCFSASAASASLHVLPLAVLLCFRCECFSASTGSASQR